MRADDRSGIINSGVYKSRILAHRQSDVRVLAVTAAADAIYRYTRSRAQSAR